jgi:hypothetical protein
VLVTRGTLLVLIDLAVLGSIWFLMVTADGALPRWWRLRRKEIVTSYRTRLTVALFACFLVPSLLFGLWSFRRLQDDDRRARDLVVHETLRGIATSDSVQLAQAAERFETPLFLYADGLLVGTSDPLLDAIAPMGRLLPRIAASRLRGVAADRGAIPRRARACARGAGLPRPRGLGGGEAGTGRCEGCVRAAGGGAGPCAHRLAQPKGAAG